MAKGQKKQKQTDEVLAKLDLAFSYGAPIKDACYYAGIVESTYHRWCKENPKLSERFERQRAKPVMKALESWMKNMPDDWRAAESFLKRVRYKDFGDKINQDHTTDGEKMEGIFIGNLKDDKDK